MPFSIAVPKWQHRFGAGFPDTLGRRQAAKYRHYSLRVSQLNGVLTTLSRPVEKGMNLYSS
jgi:hypothetical protein